MAANPPPPLQEGFVRIRHPKLPGTADVPADNLDHYREIGWSEATEDDSKDDDIAEAPAEAEETQP